ncbi:MAG: HAD family hydrolase [Mycobacterium leprae]
MYKLLATDMDGTLLCSRKVVTRANAAAIRSAVRRGVQFVICTGRSYHSARIFGWLMGVRPYIVAANGASGHAPDGRVLFQSPMPDPVAAAAIRILRRYGVAFQMYTPGGVVIEGDRPRRERIRWSTLGDPAVATTRLLSRLANQHIAVPDAIAHLTQGGPALKFFCPVAEPDRRAQALADLADARLPLTVSSSGRDNFELNAEGVHKARGLERLTTLLGVDRADVIAVGDHLNDLEMLQWAGLGVAMANGVPEAKAATRAVTASNDEDGVAQLIRRYILDEAG